MKAVLVAFLSALLVLPILHAEGKMTVSMLMPGLKFLSETSANQSESEKLEAMRNAPAAVNTAAMYSSGMLVGMVKVMTEVERAMPGTFDIPNGINPHQMSRIVCEYVDQHPEMADRSPDFVFYEALSKKFFVPLDQPDGKRAK